MPFPSKESNPFASQIMFPQAATNTSNWEGEKKTHTEPSEMGMRRRRESVDFETMARKENKTWKSSSFGKEVNLFNQYLQIKAKHFRRMTVKVLIVVVVLKY